MNTETHEIIWPSMYDRDEVRKAQDRIIEICESRGFSMDVPISDLQYGCPSANQLKQTIWPDYVACLRSFLHEFDQ